jgi:hypothetical protein
MFILKYSVKMAVMNAIPQPLHHPTPPAVFAMLSYSVKLLLTETSTATVKRDASHSTLDNLGHRATAITTTLKTVEGYVHYGIND